ncbi:hypothetical protein Javan249_0018 [Streptococcus phage Javan249]|uniref:hypothetical protein n=1 Tax=Streptococcus halotolerans TaxID=1814128 RepID=UPI0009EEC01C|nr:hypothetical protein [Streptococcus halotolerans]QBX16384.1 hypothetical protein Javan249_0018 [Streptococcus phage Javan249]
MTDFNNNVEREFDWNDTLVNDGNEFILLPAGEYEFEITKFERGRFNGSEKMPACPKAELTFKIESPQGTAFVSEQLLLHSKMEWRLSAFFAAIGQKKKGQPLQMNWNTVIGSKGRCKVIVNKYTNRDGAERKNNRIDSYIMPEGYETGAQQTSQTQPAQQQPQAQQTSFFQGNTTQLAQPQQPTQPANGGFGGF